MNPDGLLVFAGVVSGVEACRAAGFEVAVAADAEALRRLLADRYDIMLVVAGVTGAAAAVVDMLQAPRAPAAIFVGEHPGITLSRNVVGYLDAGASGEAVRDAVLAALPKPHAVGDFSDRDAQKLNSLGREVERIARALSDIASATQAEQAAGDTVDPAYVRAIIRRRRERERHFPAELFGDPAWDMLLDLTAARLERRLVSVSSLCIAAAVPTTTALRWIRNLCELGIFERNVDPDDLRRGLISLSDDAAARMLAYLAAGRSGAAPI